MVPPTGPIPKPAAEVEVTAALVRSLLAAQHPDLAARPLRFLSEGWDNSLWRVGDDLVARLPSRQMAADLVAREIEWLPRLVDRVPLRIPAPVRVGEPTAAYPWAWTLTPWLDGTDAITTDPADDLVTAERMGGFVAAMHRDPAPAGLGPNPVRGVPLSTRHDPTVERIAMLAEWVDPAVLRRVWDECCEAPEWPEPPRWLHGDLHRGNVLVDDGVVTAVIDFGDTCAGDPATDLSTAWVVVRTPEGRRRFAEFVDADEATWRRARGWALSLGTAYAAHGAGSPGYFDLGMATLDAVLTDPTP